MECRGHIHNHNIINLGSILFDYNIGSSDEMSCPFPSYNEKALRQCLVGFQSNPPHYCLFRNLCHVAKVPSVKKGSLLPDDQF